MPEINFIEKVRETKLLYNFSRGPVDTTYTTSRESRTLFGAFRDCLSVVLLKFGPF